MSDVCILSIFDRVTGVYLAPRSCEEQTACGDCVQQRRQRFGSRISHVTRTFVRTQPRPTHQNGDCDQGSDNPCKSSAINESFDSPAVSLVCAAEN